MKRPPSVTGAITIHFLATFTLIGLSVYLLWLARSPDILNDKDAVSAIQGLKIGALILGIPAVLWMPGLFGMWKRKSWGWWLTLITGLGTASVFVYSMIADGWNALDRDDAAVTAVFVIFPLLLLLPPVRKYYRHNQSDSSPAISKIQEIAPTNS